MAKTNVELQLLQELGGKRQNDIIDWTNEQERLKRLAWLRACKSTIEAKEDGETPSIGLVNWALNLADKGISAAGSAVPAPAPARNIFVRMKNYLGRNIKEGAVNIVEGRKRRKYGIMFAGMGAGAIAGVLIGTLVFPGVGSAVGGVVGGLIAGASPVVLGVLVGVVGAFVGTFISKRIAKKFKRAEDSYQLYSKPTQRLKALTGLDEAELTKLHAFVRNRKSQFPEGNPLHTALKDLKKKVFVEGSKTGMEQLSFFLVQELEELKQNNNPARERDVALLESVLAKLAAAPNIDSKVKQYINEHVVNPEQADNKPRTMAELAQEARVDVTHEQAISLALEQEQREIRNAADILLATKIKHAKDLNQLREAFELHEYHLLDIKGGTIDPAKIIKKIGKLEQAQIERRSLSSLGRIPYVNDKYGLEAKVKELAGDAYNSKRSSVILRQRPEAMAMPIARDRANDEVGNRTFEREERRIPKSRTTKH